jgi:hypothetical protein
MDVRAELEYFCSYLRHAPEVLASSTIHGSIHPSDFIFRAPHMVRTDCGDTFEWSCSGYLINGLFAWLRVDDSADPDYRFRVWISFTPPAWWPTCATLS